MANGSWRSRCLLLFCISLNFSSILLTSVKAAQRNPHAAIDVDDLTKSLFPHEVDPFADEDRWGAISDAHREAWTASNQVIDFSHGIHSVSHAIRDLRTNGVKLHIDIQIVAPPHLVSQDLDHQLELYSHAMRSGKNGVSLHFSVSLASDALRSRLSMYPPSTHPVEFMSVLEHNSVSLGAHDLMYVIVNPEDNPINSYRSRKPLLGNNRVSWIMYGIEKGKVLNVPTLLTFIERAAEIVYVPSLMYFPVPFLKQLRIEVSAYTPGYEHRAHWLQSFKWQEFENSVREISVPGQTVGFFSNQVNADCSQCERAFRDMERFDRSSMSKAAEILNNDIMPNGSWADGSGSSKSKKHIPGNTFRLFIVDILKLRKADAINRMERKPVSMFPGMGIITFRSSDGDASARLEFQMIQAIVAGVHGIAEPGMYVHENVKRPSAILSDVVNRNIVRSIVEQRITELEGILESILYFDIDPAKALGDRDYVVFTQRINILVYKLRRAQDILGDWNDGVSAMHLVASSRHDMKAIRGSFGIDDNMNVMERFRDPTLRCHFSRLKRQALKATQMLESSYPSAKSILLATLSFTVASVMTNKILQWQSSRKSTGKRE